MQDWQIELVKAAGMAVIGFASGYGVFWLRFQEKQKDAGLTEEQRQVEYDEFKKRRRLIGSGEVEKVERADKLTDLIIKLKTHQISREEFVAYKEELVAGRRFSRHYSRVSSKPRGQTTYDTTPDEPTEGVSKDVTGASVLTHELFVKTATFDPRLTPEQRSLIAARLLGFLDEKGPNGFPVGYDDNGDKVEWIPSDKAEIEAGDDEYWSMPLLRNENDIDAASEEFFDKVWWNRQQIWMEKLKSGEEPLSEKRKGILETAKAAAKRIEDKYGAENLGWDDFEWGMVNGKLSALRWVTGAEWDFLDT